MLSIRVILVSRLFLVASTVGLATLLAGCGQTGPLYLPTEPAAAQRATLPQTLLPGQFTRDAQTAPANLSTPPSPPAPSTAPK